MSLARITIGSLLTALLLILACQGRPSEKPPLHLNPDMDAQPKYKPQAQSAFFGDSSAMRLPVAAAVARDELRADNGYYRGLDAAGDTLDEIPRAVDLTLLVRGRERYDIFCSPCHGRVGDGKGIMVQRGYVPPPTFHQERIRSLADGHLFDVISNGVRNMPAYAHQIPVADRWAIVAYLRALQRSQNAGLEDVPVELRGKLR